MPDFKEDAEILRLVRTIKRLMPATQGGWVSWRMISREKEGTAEYADFLSSLSELPRYACYFARYQGKVRLTVEGLRFVATATEEQLSKTQIISEAVKDYARTLNPLKLRVGGIYTVTHSSKRIIQAVQVEIDDSQFPSETPVDFRPINRGSVTHGRVVGQEPDGRVLYIAFDSEVLECELPAILTIDRGFLLHRLGEQIERLLNQLWKVLIGYVPRCLGSIDDGNLRSGTLLRVN